MIYSVAYFSGIVNHEKGSHTELRRPIRPLQMRSVDLYDLSQILGLVRI